MINRFAHIVGNQLRDVEPVDFRLSGSIMSTSILMGNSVRIARKIENTVIPVASLWATLIGIFSMAG
jgi:hypothetical protein